MRSCRLCSFPSPTCLSPFLASEMCAIPEQPCDTSQRHPQAPPTSSWSLLYSQAEQTLGRVVDNAGVPAGVDLTAADAVGPWELAGWLPCRAGAGRHTWFLDIPGSLRTWIFQHCVRSPAAHAFLFRCPLRLGSFPRALAMFCSCQVKVGGTWFTPPVQQLQTHALGPASSGIIGIQSLIWHMWHVRRCDCLGQGSAPLAPLRERLPAHSELQCLPWAPATINRNIHKTQISPQWSHSLYMGETSYYFDKLMMMMWPVSLSPSWGYDD